MYKILQTLDMENPGLAYLTLKQSANFVYYQTTFILFVLQQAKYFLERWCFCANFGGDRKPPLTRLAPSNLDINMAKTVNTHPGRPDSPPNEAIPSSGGTENDQAKLVAFCARGHSGKTFTARVMIEIAHVNGRLNVVIADADRTNPTLSTYYKDAVRPRDASDEATRDWLFRLLSDTARHKYTTILDIGGGDPLLKKATKQLNLAGFCARWNIQLVLVHVVGSDLDDLAYVRDLDYLLSPPATILLLNAGLVADGRDVQAAFEPILTHEVVAKLIKRGAKPVLMPKLDVAHEVEARRLSFLAAMSDETEPPLLYTTQWQVEEWFRAVQAAFEPVKAWLP